MEIVDVLLTAGLAALPGIFISAWALFKAHAAQSVATWDDKIVDAADTIMRKLMEAETKAEE